MFPISRQIKQAVLRPSCKICAPSVPKTSQIDFPPPSRKLKIYMTDRDRFARY